LPKYFLNGHNPHIPSEVSMTPKDLAFQQWAQTRPEFAMKAQLQNEYNAEMAGKYTRDIIPFSQWLAARTQNKAGGGNVLGGLFGSIDSMKRKLRDVVANPVDSVKQIIGDANDRAGKFNDLTGQSVDEFMQTKKLGGPKQMEAANALAEGYNPAAATVWHGSPHKFNKFDASKIGTGEGAQAYGHGLYLAESPEVAQGYKTTLSPYELVKDGKQIPYEQMDTLTAGIANDIASKKGDVKAVRSMYESMAKQKFGGDVAKQRLAALDSMGANVGAEKGGSLYKVDLPDEHIAKMLDWDKPLSQQHPDVQKVLAKFDPDSYHPNGGDYDANELGQQIYQRLINDDKFLGIQPGARMSGNPGWTGALVTKKLRDAGIPGIRYLDAGSRDTGKGTSNFVVFPGNENLLQILERNGAPIENELTKAHGGIIHKALGGNVQPSLAQMKMEMLQKGSNVDLQSIGANEAPDMSPKHYFPPSGQENQSMPAPGGVATPSGMPIGGVDQNSQQPGQQLMPQQAPQQPPQPPQSAPQAGAQGQQGTAPAPQGAPMGNMLQMTPQGQTMAALGGGQPQKLAKGGKVLPREQSDANLAKFLEPSKVKERLYHATRKDFKEFKPGGHDSRISGHAIWLSNSPTNQPAAHHVGSRDKPREGTRIMPVHVQAKNPMVLDNKEMLKWAQEVYANGSNEFPQVMPKEWADKVKEDYDSIIHADPHGRGDPHEVIMFHPHQIKSATGNRGTYNPNDSDITKAKGGKVKPKRAVVLHNDLDTMRLEMTKKAK
jgi:hypothetical protein